MKRVYLIALIPMLLFCSNAAGSIRSAAIREAAVDILEMSGREVSEQAVETLTERIGVYAARYGDEVIDALRKVAPRGFKLIDDAGENAPEVIRLINRFGNEAVWVASKPRNLAIFVRHGDEAAEAMIKHPGIAAPVIEEFGRPAAKAIGAVNPQNARRIAMMTEDGDLAKMAQPADVLDVIGKFGDRAADWVWRHKGALAVGSVATAFLTDPEAFLDGTVELVQVGAEYVVRPVIETAVAPMAEEAAKSINWNLLIVLGSVTLIAFTLLFVKFGVKLFSPRRILTGKLD